MPWTKGQSGNPSGRPKVKDDISVVARKYGPAGIEMLAQWAGLIPGEPADTYAARIVAVKELLDRGYGKAVQQLVGDDDRPIAIEFSWAPMQQKTPVVAVVDDDAEVEIVWDKISDC